MCAEKNTTYTDHKIDDVALVGGCGFIGRRLYGELTKRDCDVSVYDVDIAGSDANYVDVTDLGSLDIITPAKCLINLAAEHRDDVSPVSRYDDVNVLGAENICQICRERGIQKIIFTSSVAIYGFAPPDTDESGSPEYFNDYGRTKFLAEQVYRNWLNEDPDTRTLVIIRPTVVFGEGNRGNVYNLFHQIAPAFLMIGREITINLLRMSEISRHFWILAVHLMGVSLSSIT